MVVVKGTEASSPRALRFGRMVLPLRDDLALEDEFFVPDFDEDYHFDAEALEDLAVCIIERRPAFLWGPAGCGKTSLVFQLAALLNQPVIRASLDADTRKADLVGEKTLTIDPESGQSIVTWEDGPLTTAVRRGWWFVGDEYTAQPPGIGFVFQALAEGGAMTLPSGEVAPPHDAFRLFATDNTNGRGDGTGLYAGTHAMNEANLDRFAMIQCGYLSPATEEAVLVAKTQLPAVWAKRLVEIATLIRAGFDKAEVYCTLSTRQLLAWGAFTMRYAGDNITASSTPSTLKALRRGYRLAIQGKLGAEDGKYVDGVVQRVTGIGFEKGRRW